MYAIVEIAGQQFKVEKGRKLYVHRLAGDEGSSLSFDKILLDAPCSGSGTVQTGPGARKCGFSDELLARSVKTQQALLRRALDVLAPGGVLVYATCSILADENEGVLSTITQENLTGVRVVRAFGREQYEKERFRKQNEV